MEPTPYKELSDLQILALCIWREARGEGMLGKRGVGCVVRNRINAKSFFGHDWKAVILKPYQFSSFNSDDPNSIKWPVDRDEAWEECLDTAAEVLGGAEDVTNGALYYFSPPLNDPPHAWGKVWETAHIGNLQFFKSMPTQDAIAGVTNGIAE